MRRDRRLKERIDSALVDMEDDVFAASLSTHKLSGVLVGAWACSCGYDCRIIFSVETDECSGDEVFVLLDNGKHDEVY